MILPVLCRLRTATPAALRSLNNDIVSYGILFIGSDCDTCAERQQLVESIARQIPSSLFTVLLADCQQDKSMVLCSQFDVQSYPKLVAVNRHGDNTKPLNFYKKWISEDIVYFFNETINTNFGRFNDLSNFSEYIHASNRSFCFYLEADYFPSYQDIQLAMEFQHYCEAVLFRRFDREVAELFAGQKLSTKANYIVIYQGGKFKAIANDLSKAEMRAALRQELVSSKEL